MPTADEQPATPTGDAPPTTPQADPKPAGAPPAPAAPTGAAPSTPPPPAPAPVDVEAALARQRAELEATHKAELERAATEAAAAAIESERARLAEESRLAALSEQERLTERTAKAEEAAAAARAEADKAKEDKAKAEQAEAFSRAVRDTGLKLTRTVPPGGKPEDAVVDPDIERIAATAFAGMVGGGKKPEEALRELAQVKPWLFEREADRPTTTGSSPVSSRPGPAPRAVEKPVFSQTDAEFAREKRNLGVVR